VRCDSLSLYVVLRFRRSLLYPTSCPALEVVIHCSCLLVACFFALPPFSGARSVICHKAPCCQHVVMIHCLFFNFVEPFDWVLLKGSGDEFCGPLPALFQVEAYRLPTVSLPSFPAICLLKVCMEISSLPLPPSLVCFHRSCPLFCMLVFSSLFIVQVFFVCLQCGRESVCAGGYAGLSQM
jgi:hypothetical protein